VHFAWGVQTNFDKMTTASGIGGAFKNYLSESTGPWFSSLSRLSSGAAKLWPSALECAGFAAKAMNSRKQKAQPLGLG